MPAGRPLKFKTPELLQAAVDDYFNSLVGSPIGATITGLAIHLGTFRDVLCDYQERDEFTNTIKAAKQRVEHAYEQRLINQGRAGDIFALKNFGWKDKHETEHSGNLSISPLMALLNEADGETKGIVSGDTPEQA